ncbi:MAG: TlpA disulfide reductase family protein [Vampirovibrionales bacterium]
MATPRTIVMMLTILLVVGLLGNALFQSFWSRGQGLALASEAPTCQPEADNPQRVFLPEGSTVMDFSLKTLEGDTITLSRELAKKPVLLELFASWCPHCQHSAKAVEGIYQKQKKVAVLSINAGDPPDQPSTTPEFKKQYKVRYPILERPSEALLNGYCLQGFPSFFLINQEGKVVWRFAGTLKDDKLAELKKAIKALPVSQATH